MFILSIIAARFIVFIFKKEWKKSFQDLLFFVLGAVPVLLILLLFKAEIGSSNHIMSSQGLEFTMTRLTDISRYFVVAKAFVKDIYYFSHLILSAVVLLGAYLAILGVKIEKNQIPGFATSIVALGFMIIGYFFVYVITPRPLEWHLHTSLDRIILQMWPSLLFVYFLIVSTPEQKLMGGEISSEVKL